VFKNIHDPSPHTLDQVATNSTVLTNRERRRGTRMAHNPSGEPVGTPHPPAPPETLWNREEGGGRWEGPWAGPRMASLRHSYRDGAHVVFTNGLTRPQAPGLVYLPNLPCDAGRRGAWTGGREGVGGGVRGVGPRGVSGMVRGQRRPPSSGGEMPPPPTRPSTEPAHWGVTCVMLLTFQNTEQATV